MANISDLVGKTIKGIEITKDDGDVIDFHMEDGTHFRFYHDQDCCEHVYIEDVVGDWGDLIGEPLTMAEESSNSDSTIDSEYDDRDQQWTFYKFATRKGFVDVRWYGESNGYYSTDVSFAQIG